MQLAHAIGATGSRIGNVKRPVGHIGHRHGDVAGLCLEIGFAERGERRLLAVEIDRSTLVCMDEKFARAFGIEEGDGCAAGRRSFSTGRGVADAIGAAGSSIGQSRRTIGVDGNGDRGFAKAGFGIVVVEDFDLGSSPSI